MEQIERYEQKFLVSPRLAQQLTEEIRPYVQLDAASLSGSYTVLSLYLDGERLPLYHSALSKAPQRLKLRIRTYDGQKFFLEIKRKIRGMIWKSRVAINLLQYQTLFLSRKTKLRFFMRNKYRELFSDFSDTQRRTLEEFLYWQDYYGAQATMWVGYQRQGFQSKDGHYARVTFDRQLKACPKNSFVLTSNLFESYQNSWRRLDYASVLSSQQADVILELKSEILVPQWMSTLCKKYDLTRVGVSKYGLAIDRFNTISESKLSQLQIFSSSKHS